MPFDSLRFHRLQAGLYSNPAGHRVERMTGDHIAAATPWRLIDPAGEWMGDHATLTAAQASIRETQPTEAAAPAADAAPAEHTATCRTNAESLVTEELHLQGLWDATYPHANGVDLVIPAWEGMGGYETVAQVRDTWLSDGTVTCRCHEADDVPVDPMTAPCFACNAEPGERCRPGCTGEAVIADALAEAEDRAARTVPTEARRLDAEDEHDEPTDAGPLVCAECGTSTARTYVVTFLGGDQDDPTARTEVCEPCNEELIHGPAEDETVDRHTGEPLPRGRCDTCGAPCDAEDGECTRDRDHAVAVDLDEPRRCAVGRCTYLAHDARDLEEHAALNHPRG